MNVNIDGMNTAPQTLEPVEVSVENNNIIAKDVVNAPKTDHQEPVEQVPLTSVVPETVPESSISAPSSNIKGLSSEEYNDPNKIAVTIADKDAPIVVLFGPPACGKTMTLVRLTRYLRDKKYTVEPIRTFRPSHDKNYENICGNFDVMMNQENAAKSTENISFMLVKVSRNGRTICQLLEAPGEYYFNPNNPKQPFPSYFNTIKSCRNRKIWAIMVEPDWQNVADRKNYVDRIKFLRRSMAVRDKAVFIYNKIDLTQFLIDNSGNAHMSLAKQDANYLFEGIFEPFRNPTPIARWFTPFKCDFTVFQTGDYTTAADGTKLYQQGPDVFPRRLWEIIMKRIKG